MFGESITVFLSDKNRYFTHVIQLALENYFRSKNVNVHFTENAFEYRVVDIILLAANPSESTLPHYLYSQAKTCYPLVFLIDDEPIAAPASHSSRRKKFTHISRNKSVAALL
ncbi:MULTISPECIES: hypothetical protein [Serratia]|uniref:hypothetical protein n=1 Tax=Serratia TaxID=613 RepID=UPI001F254DC4|nr:MULTISPECIES: hypothetical protein [Serratia]MCE9941647.1 hypothetical protein [Serratia liquefaciens]